MRRSQRIPFWIVVNRHGEIRARKNRPEQLLPGEHAFPMAVTMPIYEAVYHPPSETLELVYPDHQADTGLEVVS